MMESNRTCEVCGKPIHRDALSKCPRCFYATQTYSPLGLRRKRSKEELQCLKEEAKCAPSPTGAHHWKVEGIRDGADIGWRETCRHCGRSRIFVGEYVI
jgi:uncharacterized protein (DUF983 family)